MVTVIGITLKPKTLKTWALSLYICSHLESNLADKVDGENTRITNDAHDREGLRNKLEMCMSETPR